MYEEFNQLDKHKQNSIRNAALKEFAEKGFNAASTNSIVQQAGISKGSLFYYFKNKKQLYYYLIDYSLTTVENKYINHIDYSSTDLIERMSFNSKLKYQFVKSYPELNHFMSTILFKEMNNLPNNYQVRISTLMEEVSKKIAQHQEINNHLFKNKLDPVATTKIIELTIEGYFSRLREEFKHSTFTDIELSHLWDEFEVILDDLRKIFYKE